MSREKFAVQRYFHYSILSQLSLVLLSHVDMKKDTSRSRESTPSKNNKVPRVMSRELSQSRKTSGSRLKIRIKIEKHKTQKSKLDNPKVNTLDAAED